MLYISVVSHGHAELIANLGVLKHLSLEYSIIVTDNIGESRLEVFCKENEIHYIKNPVKMGFGFNNNQNFKFALNELNAEKHDYFLVLNPDVDVSVDSIKKALDKTKERKSRLSTINLVKPQGEFDFNIRRFPWLGDFILSYIGLNRTLIDKNKIIEDAYVDWAAGSFLMFKVDLYQKVNGFDVRYFMYCEDLDICKRIFVNFNEKVYYISDVKGLHFAAHNNRNILSKHFFWHLKSIFRYCFISHY